MDVITLGMARIAGFGGGLVCLFSMITRLLGHYYIGGFQVGTLLQVGIAAMIFGCFCLLVVLARHIPVERP